MSFCSLIKALTPKTGMLCFVLIDGILFNLLSVWIILLLVVYISGPFVSVGLSVSPSVCIHIFMFHSLSLCLCLSVGLSVCLYVSVCRSVSLSVCKNTCILCFSLPFSAGDYRRKTTNYSLTCLFYSLRISSCSWIKINSPVPSPSLLSFCWL